MINEIITVLKSTPALTANIPADNIFPLFRLQGSALPSVVVQLIDTEPVYVKDHALADIDLHTFEITVFAAGSPRNAWRNSVTIRNKLELWDGDDTGIDRVRMTSQATDVFEVVEAHSVTQRYECHQARS